jgi:hypothetical protein
MAAGVNTMVRLTAVVVGIVNRGANVLMAIANKREIPRTFATKLS